MLRLLRQLLALALLPLQLSLSIFSQPSSLLHDPFILLPSRLLLRLLLHPRLLECPFALLKVFHHGLTLRVESSIPRFPGFFKTKLGIQCHAPERVEQQLLGLMKLMELPCCSMS